MIISSKANVKWNARTKKHYVDCGYKFTKMNDEFEVDIHDLTKGSAALIEVKCDYCGKTFYKRWYSLVVEKKTNTIHKDCCSDCKKFKIVETAQEKYGVDSVLSLPNIQDKISKTNIDKYGASNPFASKDIQEKIRETNIAKYGVPFPLQNADILEKLRETCQQRYNVDFYVQTQVFYGEDSPVWKGGVTYSRNERASSDYIDWRKKVFIKDSYTCQCCGLHSQEGIKATLNAHHINNWKDNPESRYDVDNGITLCESCHLKFHSYFGKRHNTREQLQSFIINQGKKIC